MGMVSLMKRKAMENCSFFRVSEENRASARARVPSHEATYFLRIEVYRSVSKCIEVYSRVMMRLEWGVGQDIGARPYQEDRYVVAERFCMGYTLLAIMDGHGGDFVSEFVRKNIVTVVKRSLESQSDFNIKTALIRAYHTIHNMMPKGKSHVCGSTCVVMLLHDNHLWVANCGDSRAIINDGDNGIDLTVDHKPDNPQEMARIRRSGGDVLMIDGVARVIGELAVSRSIGDKRYAPFVIPSPDVTYYPLTLQNRYVLLATDGLWDVMSTQDVDTFVRKSAAASLNASDLSFAIIRHAYEALDANDNITVVVCKR